jgi:hypothetical protein
MPEAVEDVSLSLELPEPRATVFNDGLRLTFTIPEYGTILKIHNAYTLLAENYLIHTGIVEKLEGQLVEAEKSKTAKQEALDLCQEDRESTYKLFEGERESHYRLKRKNVLGTILWTTVGFAVGVAAGIIFYFVAAN